jgi:hypothetical protein
MGPKTTSLKELEQFIKNYPERASVLADGWRKFSRQNPDTLPTDTDILLGRDIEEAYFYLRDQHEDKQMQEQGEINPNIVPIDLVAPTILALAFRDRPKIIEDDRDYQKLAEQHKKLWLEKNPGKDFTSKEGLDYLYGSLDNEDAPTLKKDAEQAFRNNPKFKKRAERYDKEKKKVYKNTDEDPALIKTRREIEEHTKARQEYLKSHEEDKKPEDISQSVQKQSWERFVRQHPEKAKAYAQKNIDVKRTYEKQEIKKQLAEMEQKTGKQVRYVEKIHRPQGMDVEEATQRLESIIPSQPRPIAPERRATIPQAVGRRFRPPGRRAASGLGRLGTRLVTQAGLAAGRGVVAGAVAIGSMGWIVIGIIVLIALAVFLIIMFAGGGGGFGGSAPTVDCADADGNPIVVFDGNECAVNTAAYYSNLTGTAITAACLDKCTDTVSVICDRNSINTCTSPDASCGTMETFCIQYSPPPPPSAAWLYDCNSAVFDYTFFASCSGSGIITPTP